MPFDFPHLEPTTRDDIELFGTIVGLLGAAIAAIRFTYRRLRGESDAAERYRIQRRRRFAQHLADRLSRIGQQANWEDDRYADLTAEIEYQRRGSRLPSILGRIGLSRAGRRILARESSLEGALSRSRYRRILLRGEPGSGKSVALRHVALRLAEQGARSRQRRCTLPIYVNLRDFKVDGEPTPDDVRTYVLSEVKRDGDIDVATYVDEEYSLRVDRGAWMFLFDSFDEIPAVLSAVEHDEIVESYEAAIRGYASNLGDCRVVIASRDFRGPQNALDWPAFRLLNPDVAQQHRIVALSGLSGQLRQDLESKLADPAAAGIDGIVQNPMFLSMLCDFMGDNERFPESLHEIFDDFLTRRLTRDGPSVEQRFSVDIETIRRTAMQIAYCVNASVTGSSSSLAFSVDEVRSQVAAIWEVDEQRFQRSVQALQWSKLLKPASEADPLAGEADDLRFSFAHRRFQEYFATTIVAEAPDLVEPSELVGSGQWRETAVTLLQTGEHLDGICAELSRRLEEIDDSVELAPGRLKWPAGSLHLIGLVGDGLRRQPTFPHQEGIAAGSAGLLSLAESAGSAVDRVWTLDLVEVVEPSARKRVVEGALTSELPFLRDAALRRLGTINEAVATYADQIAVWLIGLHAQGVIRRERTTVRVQLARIGALRRYGPAVDALALAPWIHAALWAAVLIAFLSARSHLWGEALQGAILVVLALSIAWSHAALVLMGARSTTNVLTGPARFVGRMMLVVQVLVGSILVALTFDPNGNDSTLAQVAMVVLAIHATLWYPSLISTTFVRHPRGRLGAALPEVVVTFRRVFDLGNRVKRSLIERWQRLLGGSRRSDGQLSIARVVLRMMAAGVITVLRLIWGAIANIAAYVGGLMLLGGLGSVVYGIVWLIDRVIPVLDPSESPSDVVGLIAAWIMLLGFAAVAIGWVVAGVRRVYRDVILVGWFRRSLNRHGPPVDAEEFADFFDRARSERSRLLVVESVDYHLLSHHDIDSIYHLISSSYGPDADGAAAEVQNRFYELTEPILRRISS